MCIDLDNFHLLHQLNINADFFICVPSVQPSRQVRWVAFMSLIINRKPACKAHSFPTDLFFWSQVLAFKSFLSLSSAQRAKMLFWQSLTHKLTWWYQGWQTIADQDPQPPLYWYLQNRPRLANRTGITVVSVVVKPAKEALHNPCIIGVLHEGKTSCHDPLPQVLQKKVCAKRSLTIFWCLHQSMNGTTWCRGTPDMA